MDKKTGDHGNKGNKNAEKKPEERRAPITIRLPADLINKLRERGSVTAQIEAAVRAMLAGKYR